MVMSRMRLLGALVLVALLIFVTAALAQDPAATPPIVVPAPDSLQALLIAVLTAAPPMVIAVVRWAAPRIPSVALPVAAPFVGMLISVVAYYSTGTEVSVLVAAFAGVAGIGLRELYDQLMKRTRHTHDASAGKAAAG